LLFTVVCKTSAIFAGLIKENKFRELEWCCLDPKVILKQMTNTGTLVLMVVKSAIVGLMPTD
jgi:hypothetical protein